MASHVTPIAKEDEMRTTNASGVRVDDAADSAIEQTRVRVLPDGRLTREDAARYIGCEPKTMAMWHMLGKGPPSVLVGGRRFYYLDVLKAFVRGETADPKTR
jgi:hypothetical protein